MAKVLIATEKPFSKPAIEQVKEIFDHAGFEVILLEKYSDKKEFLQAVADVDALIVRSDLVDNEVIDAAGKLKIVVRAGAGYDNIDLKKSTEKGVIVMNTPGQNSNAVAELVFGMLIYMNRNRFDAKAGTELRGKKIGIHAYGYVGRIVAEIAKGLGMEVYAYDPFVKQQDIEKDGVKCVTEVGELYKQCQYISLHIPATEKTRESINSKLLMSMPEGATLVNTARKEVIHENDLQQVFKERKDFRYLSDISPDCKDILQENYPDRVFFTPKKMGAQTEEANLNAGVAAARQIVGFINQGDTTFKVN